MYISLYFRSSADLNYQYLQMSAVPTLHFQPSLPRLPIPDLQKTCQRYLRAQKPILGDEQYKITDDYVKKFESSEGHELQKVLKYIDAKNKHTSYISEYWFDMYLRDRIPLPINYNPFIVFINDTRPSYNTQVVRSTNLLISSLR